MNHSIRFVSLNMFIKQKRSHIVKLFAETRAYRDVCGLEQMSINTIIEHGGGITQALCRHVEETFLRRHRLRISCNTTLVER